MFSHMLWHAQALKTMCKKNIIIFNVLVFNLHYLHCEMHCLGRAQSI